MLEYSYYHFNLATNANFTLLHPMSAAPGLVLIGTSLILSSIAISSLTSVTRFISAVTGSSRHCRDRHDFSDGMMVASGFSLIAGCGVMAAVVSSVPRPMPKQ